MKTKIYYLLLFLIWLNQYSFGQTKVQVVEKTINKKISLSPNEEFKVTGEKADITIKGWNENYVSLQVVFSAKHSDKLIAEKELNYMKYSISSETNIIDVRNSFILPANISHIQSSLGVSYKIMVPQKCKLNIFDKYGVIDLSSLNATINVNSEFADIRLNAVDGVITIKNSFAEIRGNDVKGNFNCTSEKSDIFLSRIQGNYTFNTTFGSIDLDFQQNLKSLIIKGNRTSVMIRPENFQSYNYDITNKHGAIYIPESHNKLIKKDLYTSTFRFSPDLKKSLIKVQTTYSPITIKF